MPHFFWSHHCQVCSTPGTGKTSLCHLLAHYIECHEPMTNVITISTWSYNAADMRSDHWKRYLKDQGWVERNKMVFIFDEAQVTYNDGNLWNDFFKSINQYPCCCVIVFTSYGNPSTRISTKQGISMIIPNQQRVTLCPIQHMDNLPAVGLFFTQMEFDNLVSLLYPSPDYFFDVSFLNALFNITQGHVGAIIDFIWIILTDDVRHILCGSWWWSDITLQSYCVIWNHTNPSYTWTVFLQQVNIPMFVEGLSSSSIFARGLPSIPELQDPALTAVSEAVLCRSVVMDGNFANPGQTDVLLWCFRQGWLHADKIAGSDAVGYCFPSSLHHWYFEQKLLGTTLSTPVNATSLLEFFGGRYSQVFSPGAG